MLLSGADAQSYRRCLRDLYDAAASKQMVSRGTADNLANATFARIAKRRITTSNDSPEDQSFCNQELKELKKALE